MMFSLEAILCPIIILTSFKLIHTELHFSESVVQTSDDFQSKDLDNLQDSKSVDYSGNSADLQSVENSSMENASWCDPNLCNCAENVQHIACQNFAVQFSFLLFNFLNLSRNLLVEFPPPLPLGRFRSAAWRCGEESLP